MMSSSDTTSCVRHQARTRFFVIYGDFLTICGNNFADASALRVLETKTNDRLVALREEGRTEIRPDDLWLTLFWQDFAGRSLHLYDVRSFQAALPRLERCGYVRSRFVKVDEQGRLLREGETGMILVYATYKQAQCDRVHAGTIVKQYLFLYTAVNAAIDKLPDGGDGGKPPSPPSGSTDDKSETGESGKDVGADGGRGGAESTREGNPRAETHPPASSPIVAEGQAKFPGGSTKSQGNPPPGSHDPLESLPTPPSKYFEDPLESLQTPPGKDSNNNYYVIQESAPRIPPQESLAPDGAVVVGTEEAEQEVRKETVWCMEGILNLAAIWLAPLPTNRRAQQREKDQAHWEEAAQQIVADPYLAQFSEAERVELLVCVMRYMTEENTPCGWQRFMRMNYPGAQARLWHVATNLVAVLSEMRAYGWQPAAKVGATQIQAEEERQQERGELIAQLEKHRSIMASFEHKPMDGLAEWEALRQVERWRRQLLAWTFEVKPAASSGYVVKVQSRRAGNGGERPVYWFASAEDFERWHSALRQVHIAARRGEAWVWRDDARAPARWRSRMQASQQEAGA
jgi:hypothetical protein